MRTPHSVPRAPRRPGLTLIELIVVMMILIALAGLLAPMLPGMLTRAHTSTCATNIGQCGQAVVTYQQLYQQYPNNWDALTDASGNLIDYFANGSALPPSQGGPGNNPGNGEIMALTPTPAEISALTGVGITQLQAMVKTAPNDPTFNYYANADPVQNAFSVATATKLAGLDPANNAAALSKCQVLNLPITGRYVCLGIGPRCSLIGKTVQSAPVHFGDQAVLNPEYGYERFVAIFKVSDTAVPSGSFTQAQLVGVAPVHDTGLGGIDDHLQGWYQATTGGS